MTEVLKMDIEYGVLTLEGIRELLKMKREGKINIDVVDWKPKLDNYIYIKCERVEKLQNRLNEIQEDLSEVLEIKKELLR